MFLTGGSDTALELFSELESEGLIPDSATWNTMINGFVKQGKPDRAFQFFTTMVSRGMFDACSMISSLQFGTQIHAHAIQSNIINDEFFGNALIDTYMKCERSSLARRMFDHYKIKPRDPTFWNAMISGYGRNGEKESAFEIFRLMQNKNIKPNNSAFANLLSVCRRAGEVDKGFRVFEMMITDYGLTPTSQHFACIIDMLYQSEHPEKAHEFMNGILEIEHENASILMVLTDIYAAMGRWNDVERIRKIIVAKGLQRKPGYSVPISYIEKHKENAKN